MKFGSSPSNEYFYAGGIGFGGFLIGGLGFFCLLFFGLNLILKNSQINRHRIQGALAKILV